MSRGEQKNWFGRNWLWFVPVTLVVLLLGCVGCGVGMFGGVMGVIKSTEPYEVALERARTDQRVIDAIGEPVEDGFLVQGNVNIDNQGGNANLTIPISGPDGTAKIYVNATRTAGKWSFDTLEVEVDGQPERIELRDQ